MIETSKLLITGVSGMLGNNLAYYFKNKYEVLGLYNTHPVIINGVHTKQCDISSKDSVNKIINEFNPQIIIHCAALSDVDQCEIDKNLAERINILSDGIKGNFLEDDIINPLNYYGLSKYEGELEILKKENSLVFRTNFFGWNIQEKNSLSEWILDELRAKNKIYGFKDAYFSSIYTLDFARVIDSAIQKDLSGIFNCGCTDTYSKFEFAQKIAVKFGFDKLLISPISIDDFNFKAPRGKILTLDVHKLERDLDYKLTNISDSINSFYSDYISKLPNKIGKCTK
jgi:dTDP-4-dehydrorhamnose reductase